MNKGTSTAVLLAVIAAGLLLFGGLLKDIGSELPSGEGMEVLRQLKDIVSDSVSQTVTVKRGLQVNGSATHNDSFKLDEINPGRVGIQYVPEKSNVTLEGKNVAINDSEASVEVQQFQGSLLLDGDSVKMDGRAASFSSEGITIEEEFLSISIDGEYNAARLQQVELKELSFGALSGTLNTGDSVTFTLDNKPVNINGFYGDLDFEPGVLRLSGKASKISSGNETVTTG